MEKYDHTKIEKKWQKRWEESNAFRATDDSSKEKEYLLIEFPYPSGDGLHVGHVRSYTAMDVLARKKRAEGKNVLYPIGWDAFGLPAENYAIKTGVHPKITTKQNTDNFRRQIKALGLSFDWSREINTTDPAYYKWTQWIFLEMFKKGLAYKTSTLINWCPKDKVTLANEEVVDGACERCGTPVEKREKEQWMLAITKYAQRLYDDLDTVDYIQPAKLGQRNWIAPSQGAEIGFEVAFKSKAEKPNFLILHGFTGHSDTNFLPWVKKNLELRGYSVQAPQMPDTDNPTEEGQVGYVLENCKIDENTIIVGHSLGGIVAMKVIEKLPHPIRGLVLVAPAIDPKFRHDGDKPFWKSFGWEFDFQKIKSSTKFIHILSDSLEADHRGAWLKHLSKQFDVPVMEAAAEREHFCAEEEPFVLQYCIPFIRVFTTRADTLFGATFLVLAPEHPLLRQGFEGHAWEMLENKEEVLSYIEAAKNKSEIERTNADKEKTGVELVGVKAINPATKEEIPLFIADYVLGHYGTGAIMAVPAHDERDYAFAKKYEIEIRDVISNHFIGEEETAERPDVETVERKAVDPILHDKEGNFYLVKEGSQIHFAGGGIDGNETHEQTLIREVAEETGFTDITIGRKIMPGITAWGFRHIRNRNQRGSSFAYDVVINSDTRIHSEVEDGRHELIKVPKDKVLETMTWPHHRYLFEQFLNEKVFTDDGILVNSGEFDGLTSEEARVKITEAVGGKIVTTFKLRDWVFGRQRYWGEPIPMIKCEKDGWVPVPEDQLPVLLPETDTFLPGKEGESPLASMDEWVNTTCPTCKGPATRETDVMPQWAGSSWYYLRYADAHNDTEFASKENLKYWTPVNWYNGGMEHTTLHLLYSRFWHKFLFDCGLVPSSEPYMKRTSHGIIMAEDGTKMSKSKGNTVSPDTIVEQFGADSLRLYEMFIGPFDQPVPWSSQSIVGVRRFLERVWKCAEKVADIEMDTKTESLLHQAIQKVSDDMNGLKMNTSVSALMVFTNYLSDLEQIPRATYEVLLKLLAPLAPHMAAELWEQVEFSGEVASAPWPVADSKKIRAQATTVAIQINGKTRATIELPADCEKEKALEAARANVDIAPRLARGKEVKAIYVPGKIISFVVKEG